MDRKFDILKLVSGIGFIEYLLYLGMNAYEVYQVAGWKYFVIAFLSLFLMIKITAFTKNNESLWVFFILFIVTIPINIQITYKIMKYCFEDLNLLFATVYRIVIFQALLSIEEIVAGVIARILWPRQEDLICILDE